MIQCTLPQDINLCPHYDKPNSSCNNPSNCSFQENVQEDMMPYNGYVRQERWYEKYYRNWQK